MSKKVLITGASRGIGAAIAIAFAKKGYTLVLNCHKNADRLNSLKEIMEGTYHVPVLVSVGDVGDYNYITQLFEEIKNFCQGVDILVNNAGISYVGLLDQMSIDEWHQVMNTNLNSLFYTSKAAIPYMLSQKKGHIINISSVWGEHGASCEVAYSTSKGGVNAFTKALAKELAPSNIQVNAVACGCIDTDMNLCFSEEERAALAEEIPMGRFGTPKEVGELVLSLAEGNSYLTGQIITISGGWM